MDYEIYSPPETDRFPTSNRELVLAGGLLILSTLVFNSVFFAGYNLGFAVWSMGILGLSVWYLLRCGKKLTGYPAALLGLSLVILASFPRGNDNFVKFVMIYFLMVSENVALALIAENNRHSPAGFRSLLDAPNTLFRLGVGKLDSSFRGLSEALKNLTGPGKTGGAIVTGLLLAVPVLAVMVPLLTSADAAFDGLLRLLPDFRVREFMLSLFVGFLIFSVLYTRCAALIHHSADFTPKAPRQVNSVTIITLISMVCIMYGAYLLSQLAYFAGGFSGILPEGYSMAQYARRGFFEMATLSGINLGLIALSIGLVQKNPRAPLALRLECLFIGLVSLFMIISASAKMGMYITAYGLTRLRVLTEVIMVFLGLTTMLICLWLFRPRVPYMKAVMILALVMGAAVSWMDVDSVVANYNVAAYQKGQLHTLDVYYLSTLSDGAVPWLEALTRDEDPDIRQQAEESLSFKTPENADLRGWNYATARADEILSQ